MSYTKGPWEVDCYPDGGFSVTGKGGHCGLDYYVICARTAHARKEETHANARLIAAAPDLLEALQKLERYFVSGNCIPIERAVITRDSFEEIARAAIEKATKP